MVFLVLAHPDSASFCSKISTELCKSDFGTQLVYADLYKDGFNPVLDSAELKRRSSFDPLVQKYTRNLEECTMLVIIQPNWWNAPPAILKGFVDRVFRSGVAYDFKGADFETKKHTPALSGKRLYVVSVSDSEDDSQLDMFWKKIADYTGMDFEFKGIRNIRDISHSRGKLMIDDIVRYIREYTG